MTNELKRDEGFRSKPYYDTAGKLTIGYGRNLDDVGITKPEAEELLQNDIGNRIVRLNKKYEWFKFLSPARKHAIVNMAFNLGMGGLATFKRMIAAIECGHFERAALELLDSDAARELQNRYLRLYDMMLTGEFEKE